MGKTTPNKPYQQFSKNNTLNELLNETAQGDTNLESGNAPMSTDTTGMTDVVANAVTRDYSDLMGAILKKK